MENNKKILTDVEKEIEKVAILKKADEIREAGLELAVDGQTELKKEIADMVIEDIDDPEMKYQLYYKVVNRLLKKYLPKGEENKEARDFIYEEKNTFLTRGHRKDDSGIRGADGRMAYAKDINELINVITEWISCKGTAFELYTRLRDLNVSKGYGVPRND